MSIVRVKSHDLNKLNESLQRISLFEDNLKKSDIMKDKEDDTFFTDIDTDNVETVANNLNDDDDITVLDDNDSPETKRQKLIADFTNALASEMEINERLKKLAQEYAGIEDKPEDQSTHEWKMDNKKHDIYLKDKDAHIFRQNRNICLSAEQHVKTFANNQELNQYLSQHGYPQVSEDLMNSLVESAADESEVLTEAPLWGKMAKVKDWGHNLKQKWDDKRNKVDPQEIWDGVVDNKLNFIKACIEHGNDMNVPEEKENKTPLMYAVENGMTEMAEVLASAKDTVNAKDKDGWTPLMYATLPENRAELLNLLLKNGAKPEIESKDGHTAASLLEDLAQKNPNDNFDDAIEVLQNYDVNVNNGTTVDPEELVEVLKAQDSKALDKLLSQPNVAEAINQSINKQGETPLMAAASMAKASDVEKLIKAGGDVNSTDKKFRTPAMYAAASKRSDPQTVQVLEQYGANLDAQDINRKSVRDYLGQTSNTNSAETPAGDTEEAPKAKNSKKASTANSSPAAEEPEADYDFEDEEDGEYYDATSELDSLKAINQGRLDVAQTLVNHGNANVNAVDPETGESPLDQADAAGDDEMSQFLKSKGAQNAQPAQAKPEENEEDLEQEESLSDYINSLKGKVSLSEEDEEPIDECMGGVGAGVTTASFAPAVTHTMYKRPAKKKKK